MYLFCILPKSNFFKISPLFLSNLNAADTRSKLISFESFAISKSDLLILLKLFICKSSFFLFSLLLPVLLLFVVLFSPLSRLLGPHPVWLINKIKNNKAFAHAFAHKIYFIFMTNSVQFTDADPAIPTGKLMIQGSIILALRLAGPKPFIPLSCVWRLPW